MANAPVLESRFLSQPSLENHVIPLPGMNAYPSSDGFEANRFGQKNAP